MTEAKGTSLRAMTQAELVDTLGKSGSAKAADDSVGRLVAEGKLANPDGTIDLIKFIAYLAGRRNGKL